jgi:hypothetical protein|tara:strand:- start:3046 stop:3444 length:399 start_codon:yes stop_codon:yes gene_type:complete
MYNKDQLIGILLCIPKPEIHISRADNIGMGYRIRLRLNIRGAAAFLKGVARSLEQHGIQSIYKDKEHNSRPRPILRVSGIVNLHLIAKLVDVDLPDAKDSWEDFREVIEIFDRGEHHTPEGLDRILTIKGVI